MNLTVRDVARMLSVSEKTIYRWITQKKLPASRIGDQYRFSRAELLEWATAQKVRMSPVFFEEDMPETAPSLRESLCLGGIYYRIGGSDKGSVLAEVVRVMPLPSEVDRDYLLDVIMARELLGSTGFGHGVALPHARTPIVMHVPRPIVSVCFLEHPVDFNSIDGEPIRIIIPIVSPTIRGHLAILSRVSFALRDQSFMEMLMGHPLREDVFAAATRIDDQITAFGNS